jgi:hypothetical protein
VRNKEQARAYNARYRAEHQDEIRAYNKQYAPRAYTLQKERDAKPGGAAKRHAYKQKYARTYKTELTLAKQKKRATPEGRMQSSLYNIKSKASGRGLEFNITLVDLLPLPVTCPVLGLVIDYTGKQKSGRIDTSPSVDRIDNTKGYVPGNVRVISWRANKLKSDATAAELRLIAADATRLEG